MLRAGPGSARLPGSSCNPVYGGGVNYRARRRRVGTAHQPGRGRWAVPTRRRHTSTCRWPLIEPFGFSNGWRTVGREDLIEEER